MEPGFLESYLRAMPTIEGWFSFDAALMFMAYHGLLAENGISGDLLEIGVHHGLSAIALGAMRSPDARLYAIDLFEDLQGSNVSRSGGGDRPIFEKNLKAFFNDTRFVQILACSSSQLKPEDFERPLCFAHVDGGHSVEETYHDLELCHHLLCDGGLLALDDYFNPQFPGVCEGAIEFVRRYPDKLRPLAIGFNKILLEKNPRADDLNSEFTRRFAAIPHQIVCLWGKQTLLFLAPFRSYFDLHRSTPRRLIAFEGGGLQATLIPETMSLTAEPNTTIFLPVMVGNASGRVLAGAQERLGLSYHLLSEGGATLQHDNQRMYLTESLAPGEQRVFNLAVRAPERRGVYQVEIDLVLEGVMWFKQAGNVAPIVRLTVSQPL